MRSIRAQELSEKFPTWETKPTECWSSSSPRLQPTYIKCDHWWIRRINQQTVFVSSVGVGGIKRKQKKHKHIFAHNDAYIRAKISFGANATVGGIDLSTLTRTHAQRIHNEWTKAYMHTTYIHAKFLLRQWVTGHCWWDRFYEEWSDFPVSRESRENAQWSYAGARTENKI